MCIDLDWMMIDVHQGVQKFSKIVINGSILTTKYTVERLDKKEYFQRKQNNKKNCVKNFGCAVKKWSKRRFLSSFLARVGKNHQRQKKCARVSQWGKKKKTWKKKVIN